MSTAELDSAAEFDRRAELLGVPQLYRDALRIQQLTPLEDLHFRWHTLLDSEMRLPWPTWQLG